MKHLFIILATLSICLVACDSNNFQMPALKLDIPKNADAQYRDFIEDQIDQWNDFAKLIAKQYAKAQDLIKDKKFEDLSIKEQAKIVELDLNYASAWLDANVRLTEMQVEAIDIFPKLDDSLKESFKECTTSIVRYVALIKKTYKEDLKLDPHAIDPDSIPNSNLVDSLGQKAQELVEKAETIKDAILSE